MPKNDIGGFFVSLGLNIDKDSWETGNRLIDGVGNSFNKLIGSTRNAAVVLAGTAAITGQLETAAYKTSQALGLSTEALDVWKASAKIADVNADAIVSSLRKISSVQARIKYDGSGLSQLQSQLDKLQMSYAEIQDMDAGQATQKILEKAQYMLNNGSNMLEVAAYVEDILGAGARDLLIDLDRRGLSVKQGLAEGQSKTFTNSGTNAEAQNFMTEVRLLKQAAESMSKLLGSEVANQLTDYVKDINDWIDEHGTDIANGIKTVSEGVGKLVGKFVDFITDEDVQEAAKAALNIIKDSVTETFEGTKKIAHGIVTGNGSEIVGGGKQALTGAVVTPAQAITEGIHNSDWATGQRSKNEAEAEIRAYKKKKGYGLPSSIPYEELTPDLQSEFDKYAEKSFGHFRFAGAVKDGIVRPDGTVTQVAPDDWVIAARNLGDVARAFQPEQEHIVPQDHENNAVIEKNITQNYTVAPEQNTALNTLAQHVGMLTTAFIPQQKTAVSGGEYTINQTFNISGGNDMPQVIRQQAYRGTQDGLLAVMEESSRRLQLMSGTR